MSRPRMTLPPVPEAKRHDTIGLRTIVTYDPMAPRPTTPIMVGPYEVARSPLLGSIHTLYMILDGKDVARTSISVPSEHDCAAAILAHRRRQAASMTDAFIDRAKKRRARAKASEVTA